MSAVWCVGVEAVGGAQQLLGYRLPRMFPVARFRTWVAEVIGARKTLHFPLPPF